MNPAYDFLQKTTSAVEVLEASAASKSDSPETKVYWACRGAQANLFPKMPPEHGLSFLTEDQWKAVREEALRSLGADQGLTPKETEKLSRLADMQFEGSPYHCPATDKEILAFAEKGYLEAKEGHYAVTEKALKLLAHERFIVRLWDMFDGWMDLTGPLSREEAYERWNRETKDGTQKTKYADGDYYKVFPADTRMVVTPEFLGR